MTAGRTITTKKKIVTYCATAIGMISIIKVLIQNALPQDLPRQGVYHIRRVITSFSFP